MAIPVVQNAVLGAVASSAVGKASGANSMTQELGVAILVIVFTTTASYTSTLAFINGVTAALTVCATLTVTRATAALAGGGQPI